MLDNGASACITNDKDDFVEPPKRVDCKVRGIEGHAKATHRGTVKWYVEDDSGLVHIMVIKGAYLIPEVATQILLLQHLAQRANDHYPKEEGTRALTTSKHIMLFWSQRKFTKNMPLGPSTNIGLTTTASSAWSFCAFCTTLDMPETRQTNIFMMHIIPGKSDEDSIQPKDPVKPSLPKEDNPKCLHENNDDLVAATPQTTLIDLCPVTHVIPED